MYSTCSPTDCLSIMSISSPWNATGRRSGPGIDAEGFVTESLARILRQLNSRTEHEHVETQGRVRDKVIWPATLKQRDTCGYAPPPSSPFQRRRCRP